MYAIQNTSSNACAYSTGADGLNPGSPSFINKLDLEK